MLIGDKPVVGLLLISSANVARYGLANHRTFFLLVDCVLLISSEIGAIGKAIGERNRRKNQKGEDRRDGFPTWEALKEIFAARSNQKEKAR